MPMLQDTGGDYDQFADAAMQKLLTNKLNAFKDALQKCHLPFDMWEAMKAGSTRIVPLDILALSHPAQ